MLRSFLRFLLENRLLELSGHLVLWPLMGALAGSLVGVWAYRLVRSRGGFRLEVWGARVWRGLACALIVAAFTAGGTYAGVCEGLWRGVRAAFAEGTLVSEVVTSLGQVEAILLAGLYHGARGVSGHPGITPGDEARLIGDGLDAFISGREELGVGDLRRQLDTMAPKSWTKRPWWWRRRSWPCSPFCGTPAGGFSSIASSRAWAGSWPGSPSRLR